MLIKNISGPRFATVKKCFIVIRVWGALLAGWQSHKGGYNNDHNNNNFVFVNRAHHLASVRNPYCRGLGPMQSHDSDARCDLRRSQGDRIAQRGNISGAVGHREPYKEDLRSGFCYNSGDDLYTRTAFNLCATAIGQRGTISGAGGHRGPYKEALGERFLP